MIYTILTSYLGDYPNAAPDRPRRLRRAIDSFFANDYAEKQLIVVADGCEETTNICKDEYPDALCLPISKRSLWSGDVRDRGLDQVELLSGARDLVCYLDSDDYFGPDHLASIAQLMGDNDFILWPMLYRIGGELRQLACHISYGSTGTGGIAHRARLNARWESGYGHDFRFVYDLLCCNLKYAMVSGPQYYVCHGSDWSS